MARTTVIAILAIATVLLIADGNAMGLDTGGVGHDDEA